MDDLVGYPLTQIEGLVIKGYRQSVGRRMTRAEAELVRDWVRRKIADAVLLDQVLRGEMVLEIRDGEITFTGPRPA